MQVPSPYRPPTPPRATAPRRRANPVRTPHPHRTPCHPRDPVGLALRSAEIARQQGDRAEALRRLEAAWPSAARDPRLLEAANGLVLGWPQHAALVQARRQRLLGLLGIAVVQRDGVAYRAIYAELCADLAVAAACAAIHPLAALAHPNVDWRTPSE